VVLDSFFPQYRLDTVVINNRQGAWDAADHLVAQGHTQIGYLKSSVPIQNFRERFEGCRACLEYHGLPLRPEWVFLLDPTTMEDSCASFQNSLPKRLPTAFFADNDIIAMGAMKALALAGLRLPEDVSLVGFDNLPLCAMLHPAMTTVHVPKEQLGRLAVERLLWRMANPEETFVKIEVGGRLTERGSVRRVGG
jgi:LacI family transcriptional regulator